MTYLQACELGKKLKYSTRYINEVLRPSVLKEGRHYFRPFGGRRILYIWEHIEKDMFEAPSLVIDMANGGVCNG